MADFRERLQKAVERGQQTAEDVAAERAQQALSEEELRRLHSAYRLELGEHIEACLKQLREQIPGFRYEDVSGDRGWGGAVARDDFAINAGKRSNVYSRLELSVRPFSVAHVIEITAKGTVQNKEIFSRHQYQELRKVDAAHFFHLIDQWVLEFAEIFVSRTS